MDPNVFSSLNYWAVLAAAVSAFVIGGAWYSPALFGKLWQRETGLTDAQLQAGSPGKIFGLSFVMALVAALVFAMFLGPKPAFSKATMAGILAGAAWVGTSFGINYLFERKSLALFLVNAGYHLVQYAVIGAILGLWH
jgi:hypothetical protein